MRRLFFALFVLFFGIVSVSPAAVVVPKLSSWSYLVPASDPTTSDADFYTTWNLPTATFGTYNGAAFAGPSPGILGYGDTKNTTPTTGSAFQDTAIPDPGSPNRNSAYFRRDFTLAANATNLYMTGNIDDGAVVYLDGAEIGRFNMPATGDTWTLQASGGATENVYSKIPLTISSVAAGTHTLAVAVHNNAATVGTSSDLTFDLSFDSGVAPQTPIQVISPSTSENFTLIPVAGVPWGSGAIAGGGNTFGVAASTTTLLTEVQKLNVSSVLTPLASVTTTGNTALPQHNSTNSNVQTSPTGNAANLLSARLQNATGATVTNLNVTYQLGVANPAAATLPEELPGHDVFYSFTGAPNTWVEVGQRGYQLGAQTSPQLQTLNLALGSWAAGADLYLLWADDNADGFGDYLYTIDDVTFQPLSGTNLKAAVTVTPGTGTGRIAGQTVTVANASVTAPDIRDAAALSVPAFTGAGFSQTGMAGGSIGAGQQQVATVVFNKTSTMLNGPAYGTMSFTVTAPAGATGVGSYSYNLSATVSGNTGDGTSVVPAGLSYAGLSSKSIKTVGSTATILDGINTTGGSSTVGMVWRDRTVAETPHNGLHPLLPAFANGLTSDVVNLTGTDNQLFVLQMTYNTADLQQPAANNQAMGQLFVVSPDAQGNWVNAVLMNHNLGNNTTNPAFINVNSSYSAFLAANGGALLASMQGAWGVDLANNSVWAVLNHNSEFASVPEPSSIVLGSFGLLGLVYGAIRRRRNA